jgi:methylated-DNA-[protein]-cysteine S-methyltransferase
MSKKHMPTSFQECVYRAVKMIPRGKVTSYKNIAEHLGCASYRPIGQALRMNPYAPRVPCHRVIASDLTIGGFRGRREGTCVRRKLKLLEKEGVRFKNERLENKNLIYRFDKQP